MEKTLYKFAGIIGTITVLALLIDVRDGNLDGSIYYAIILGMFVVPVIYLALNNATRKINNRLNPVQTANPIVSLLIRVVLNSLLRRR